MGKKDKCTKKAQNKCKEPKCKWDSGSCSAPTKEEKEFSKLVWFVKHDSICCEDWPSESAEYEAESIAVSLTTSQITAALKDYKKKEKEAKKVNKGMEKSCKKILCPVLTEAPTMTGAPTTPP